VLLISGIEINYFRSVYKEKMLDLQPLNIIFGRNDSGKSNVLRALNLFFNSETNPGQAFGFSRDICRARVLEANSKKDARKFISIKVTFKPPKEYQKSLGGKVFVKRTWSVQTGVTYTENSPVKDSIKHQYLTRFLNRIRYHYIPAIKDRRIFENLLGQVYEVLSIDRQFTGSLDAFANEVKSKTAELTKRVKRTIGLTSVISPPVDLTDLFRSLDFETRDEDEDDDYSLTLQRGDGVQMQHIPTILKFISDRSRQAYHIWGFEEPENSLELANAISEAGYFQQLTRSGNIQMFVTSHSPAFFNLEDNRTARFFVSRAVRIPLRQPTSRVLRIAGLDLPGELMGETPHLSVLSNYLRKANLEIGQLQKDRESLRAQICKSSSSIVFVEGESDALILDRAWKLFNSTSASLNFRPCEGTTKMKSLAQDGPVFAVLAPGRKIFCIVDNDHAGRELYKNGRLAPGGRWVKHNSNGTYWCRLKPTNEFEAAMNDFNIDESCWPFVIESCFSCALRLEANEQGVYKLVDCPFDELCNSQNLGKIAPLMRSEDFRKKAYIFPADESTKLSFANWVAERADSDPTILEPFRTIIEGISNLIHETYT